MNVELVSVGTEILLGNIVNTNAAYLSEMCARLGLSLYYQTVVGDNESRLSDTVKTALSRSDIVIFTGGLGPTDDDLTKEMVAKAMGLELREDKATRKHIEEFLKVYEKNHPGRKITKNNWKQSMAPEGAIILENDNGTAPGLIIEKDGKTAILLPGPPAEMVPMFEKKVYPYLQKKQDKVICSQTIKICGIGESQVAEEIADLIDKQTNPTIAPYAKTGEVHLRLTASAKDEKEGKKMIKPLVRELKVRFGKNIYTTEENKTLEQSVVELLKARDLTLSLAESCTGGMIAARIVNVSGASDVFMEGFVTYTEKAKRKRVLVKKSTLKKETAVSAKTAKEMAKGGCITAGTDICVSVTGYAGPDGGMKEHPVGTVFIGCCIQGTVSVRECHFTGNRDMIREKATVEALTLLRDCILDTFKK